MSGIMTIESDWNFEWIGSVGDWSGDWSWLDDD